MTFTNKGGGNVSAYCTCPAGQNGMYCKHRFGILSGQSDGIVSGNESDIPSVQAWLPGSDIDRAMDDVRKAEAAADAAKRALTASKKALALAMMD